MRTTGPCLYISTFGSSINDNVQELSKKRQAHEQNIQVLGNKERLHLKNLNDFFM